MRGHGNHRNGSSPKTVLTPSGALDLFIPRDLFSTEAAEATLTEFEQGTCGKKCPPIKVAWRRQWTQVIKFFAYPPEVRKIIYTTKLLYLGLAQHCERLEDSATDMEGEGQSIRQHVRRTIHVSVKLMP